MATTVYGIKVYNTDVAIRRLGADPKGHIGGSYYFNLEDADAQATVIEALDTVARTEIVLLTVY